MAGTVTLNIKIEKLKINEFSVPSCRVALNFVSALELCLFSYAKQGLIIYGG